jgi:SAM-dependent methyltransferase
VRSLFVSDRPCRDPGRCKLPLNGYLDVCTDALIGGWVWDSEHPARRLAVEIRADGKPMAQLIASQYREDLKKNGIGDGDYGYSYVPSSRIDLNTTRISVVVLGTDTQLDRSLTAAARSEPPALNWPPIRVELDADANALLAMHAHVNQTWSRLGSVEPYWSVLTHPEYRTEAFSAHAEQFFESGKSGIEDFRAFALRSGLHLSANQVCFELGCGVGRLTAWLSPIFSRVIAADISANHLRLAETALDQRGIRNVSFLQLNKLNDLETVSGFDVFFSVIVLQHNPPPIIAYMLRTILGRLNANGLGYFQVPTYSRNYDFRMDKYLSEIQHGQNMEMHVLPQQHVLDIIYECDCKLLEIREDGWTGQQDGISNTLLIQKKR